MMTPKQSEFESLQQSIEQSKFIRAAELTALERLRGGADLFDEGMRWLAFAIEADNPGLYRVRN